MCRRWAEFIRKIRQFKTRIPISYGRAQKREKKNMMEGKTGKRGHHHPKKTSPITRHSGPLQESAEKKKEHRVTGAQV